MYYRMVPALAMVLVVCCLVFALASAFGGNRIGFGGYYPPVFLGPSWSHGGYYHGSFGGGGSSGSFGGSSGRSPSHGFSGGGFTGGHGGK